MYKNEEALPFWNLFNFCFSLVLFSVAPCGLISWPMRTLSPSGDPWWDPPKCSEPETAFQTPSVEAMASLTPGTPLTAQVDLSLAQHRAVGRCEWWCFVCLYLLSLLGVKVSSFLSAADSTHTCPGVTKLGAFLYGFCLWLWNKAYICGARLASLIFSFCFLTDSPASASREIAFFFPEFNERLWYEQEEPRLRCGPVFYNAEERVHCPLRDGESELTWVPGGNVCWAGRRCWAHGSACNETEHGGGKCPACVVLCSLGVMYRCWGVLGNACQVAVFQLAVEVWPCSSLVPSVYLDVSSAGDFTKGLGGKVVARSS